MVGFLRHALSEAEGMTFAGITVTEHYKYRFNFNRQFTKIGIVTENEEFGQESCGWGKVPVMVRGGEGRASP